MDSEPTTLRQKSENELLSLLQAVDRAIRIAGDDATGMTKFRWAILAELAIRAAN
jgi:hypothetical protein